MAQLAHRRQKLQKLFSWAAPIPPFWKVLLRTNRGIMNDGVLRENMFSRETQGVILASVSAGKNMWDEKCKSFLRDKRNVKFGENLSPNKTERECEKSSESETVRQRDRVKIWPGQNLVAAVLTPEWYFFTRCDRYLGFWYDIIHEGPNLPGADNERRSFERKHVFRWNTQGSSLLPCRRVRMWEMKM